MARLSTSAFTPAMIVHITTRFEPGFGASRTIAIDGVTFELPPDGIWSELDRLFALEITSAGATVALTTSEATSLDPESDEDPSTPEPAAVPMTIASVVVVTAVSVVVGASVVVVVVVRGGSVMTGRVLVVVGGVVVVVGGVVVVVGGVVVGGVVVVVVVGQGIVTRFAS